jgi:hypothetical protein
MKNPAMPSSSEHMKEKSKLEEAMTQLANNTSRFMTETNTNLQNQAASIQNLEVQVGQLANMLTGRQQGTLPSTTEINPKEQCKAITLRSGKEVEQTVGNKSVGREEEEQVATPFQNMKKSDPLPEPTQEILQRIPFPQRLKKNKLDKQFSKFLDVFKKLQINIPFADALEQMPSYVKFLKDILSNKRKLEEYETAVLTEECSAILQKKLPPKLKDPGSFTIPCSIGNSIFEKALCDLGASINLMPLSIFKKLGLGEAKPTTVTMQLADRSLKHPRGIIEDVLVKVGKFIFPADFIILVMEEDNEIPILLGRPFLATGGALIDVKKGELRLRVNEEEVIFNVFKAIKQPDMGESCFSIQVVESLINDKVKLPTDPLEACLLNKVWEEDAEIAEYICWMDSFEPNRRRYFEDLGQPAPKIKSTSEQAPVLELQPLPEHLWYAYLGEASTYPVIVSAKLSKTEEEKLLRVLRNHKAALGWVLADIKGISPSICMHKILLEDEVKPTVEHQRRLNPTMKEVVRKEVLKWLDAGVIYPISDSSWVSPVQVVPKKGGITVVKDANNNLIPTKPVTGWRICMDYRKLNKATRKDHFPLPFIDQMLDRLAGHEYYYFLDGYSGYNQIAIAPEDQEKTTFTCPYGTFAFRRMPFGLCNTPATFQRCMMAIFSDMVEQIIEVFMDDFSVFGTSFDDCLAKLALVLERCEKTNLILNWEKCHFMVKEGIVLGHRISEKGIEVDRAKIKAIDKLLPPTTVKGVRSFLGHSGFYRRFIKDFSKISKPLYSLLLKDTKFQFDEECKTAFMLLKKKLVTAPIVIAPDWEKPFELMCDASDYAVGAVLGQ